MGNNFGRPNENMRYLIDTALRRQNYGSQRQVAADLDRQRVPLQVIARVLLEPGRRRTKLA